MQSRITRYFFVGLMAFALMGAGLLKEAQAQWAPVASPYHAHAYPAYVAWRPFGGLFAGLHHALCHRCHLSPCRCVMPTFYDPCYTPCYDPCATTACCDPCLSVCGCTVGAYDSCGCSTRFSYFAAPTTATSTTSTGIPSPTGFGSVTPAGGIPGQRPVGTPAAQSTSAAQRPALPPTARTPVGSQGTLVQPPVTTTPSGTGPTMAPPQNGTTESIDDRLDSIRRRGQPGFDTGATGDPASIPPTTDYGNPATGYGNPATGTTPATPRWTDMPDTGGTMTPPGTGERPGVGTDTGGSTNNMLMNLGSGAISVTVPENSKVYINGYETRMTGTNRCYVVNDLAPGQAYDYEIRIIADVNGRLVEDTQLVTLTGGGQSMIAFGQGRQYPADNGAYLAARPVH